MSDTPRLSQPLTVGQVADAYGVTVRTLHHYDEIGLLRPSERSASGYRLYSGADLRRLQSIVVYRRLDFGLEEIAELLREGTASDQVVTHLRRQRATVESRLDELSELVRAIDNALEREMNDEPATIEDMKELFGDAFDDARGEVEERWGDSAAWKESQERSATYTKSDWARIKEQSDGIEAAFLDAKRAGQAAASVSAMDAAEAHRVHIDTWFYTCPPSFHRNLGELYTEEKYRSAYDDAQHEPGLAEYVRAAIMANADRQEAAS